VIEQEIKIPIPDSKLCIYGTLRGSLKQPMVVFVHGLTGHRHEHIYFNGSRFFEKHGLASFRFNLYDGAQDARKMADCTIKIHAADLDTVIEYMTNRGVKQIFAVGHSYGAPTILSSKKRGFEAVVLWDPHHAPIRGLKQQGWQPVGVLSRYMIQWNSEVLIGEAMYKENVKLDCDKLAAKFKVPTKIIYAKNGILEKASKSYYKHLAGKKDIVGLKNATHCFDEEGTEEELFQETYEWFLKK
jgi:hypothetical protein